MVHRLELRSILLPNSDPLRWDTPAPEIALLPRSEPPQAPEVQKTHPHHRPRHHVPRYNATTAQNGGLSSETLRARLHRSLSWTSAAAHADAMQCFKTDILDVAKEKGVDPAIIAGVLSRESGAGLLLDRHGLGDYGHGHGIMQIDDRSFPDWLAHNDWRNPRVNIDKGVSVLLDKRAEVLALAKENGLHPTESQLFHWSLSAYNAGAYGAIEGVIRHGRSDAYTTDHNYAADVLGRAEYYREHGYEV